MSNEQSAIRMQMKKYCNGSAIILVEDDPITLDMYKESLSEFFTTIETAVDGLEAYKKWKEAPNKYDLIVTDAIMPNMTGADLIRKISEESTKQKFIILSGVDNLLEIHELINLGVHGFINKPFELDKFLNIAIRVMEGLYYEKIMKTQIKQLLLLLKANAQLKTNIKQTLTDEKIRTPKIQKDVILGTSSLSVKYDVRKTQIGESSESFLETIDYVSIDNIDVFQDKVIELEVILCKRLNRKDNSELKKIFILAAETLGDFAASLNVFGKFPVAAKAANHFKEFLQELDESTLEDAVKRNLIIESLLYLLQDINDWVITVFIKRNATNVNYFDASFANSCMEIEMMVKPQEIAADDDETLEFF